MNECFLLVFFHGNVEPAWCWVMDVPFVDWGLESAEVTHHHCCKIDSVKEEFFLRVQFPQDIYDIFVDFFWS
jgi:hypothetical protein